MNIFFSQKGWGGGGKYIWVGEKVVCYVWSIVSYSLVSKKHGQLSIISTLHRITNKLHIWKDRTIDLGYEWITESAIQAIHYLM